MEHSVPIRFASYEGMDIGTDNGLPVVPKLEYAKVLPKYFKGTIEKVEFDLAPAKLSAEDSSTAVSATLRQRNPQLIILTSGQAAIADKLSKAGWSWGCVSAVHSQGQTSGLRRASRRAAPRRTR